MRWFVEISPLGSKGGPSSTLCVDAPQWQPALQKARALRGDNGALSNFSIELLDEGFRAVDPTTRLRYTVKRAPDDAQLSPTSPAPAQSVPMGETPKPPAQPVPMGGDPPARSIQPATAEVAAPTKPVVPAKAEPTPEPDQRPLAQTVPYTSQGAAAVREEPQPAKVDLHQTQAYGSPGIAVAREAPAPKPEPPKPSKTEPPKSDAAKTEPTPPKPAPEAAKPLAAPKAEPAKPSLPEYTLLSSRNDNPSEASPLTYRELVLAVAPGTPEDEAKTLILNRFEHVRASLDPTRTGKLVNLAVFDHVFQGKPKRRPLVTLTWKDWKGGDPEIQFPAREAPSSAATPLPAAAAAPVTPIGTTLSSAKPVALPKPAPTPEVPVVAAPQPVKVAEPAAKPVKIPEPVKPEPTKAQPGSEPTKTQPGSAKAQPTKAQPGSVQPGSAAPQPGSVQPGSAAPQPGSAEQPAKTEPAKVAAKAAEPAPSPDSAAPTRPVPTVASPAASAAPVEELDVQLDEEPPAPAKAEPAPASANPKSAPLTAKPIAASKSTPPPAPKSTPPPAPKSTPPPAAKPAEAPVVAKPKKRLSGDDLITELFEAFGDLHFLHGALAGAEFVLSLTMEKLPSEVGLVSFFDMNKREFVVVRQSGSARSALCARQGERAPLALEAMRKRRAIVVADKEAAARAMDDRFRASGVELRSLVCAPVELGGRYLGLIEIANPLDGGVFNDGDGNALTYIGQQFAEFVATHGVVVDPEQIREQKTAAPAPAAAPVSKPISKPASSKKGR